MTLANTLLAIRPGAQWSLTGDTLAGLTWLDPVQAVPAQSEIDTWTAGQAKRDLYGYAAQKRYVVMTGGVLMSGMIIPTTDDSASRFKNKRDLVKEGIAATPFTMVIGTTTIQADLPLLTAAVTAISNHWQTCFNVQSDANAKIGAGSLTTNAQIDALAWPSNT